MELNSNPGRQHLAALLTSLRGSRTAGYVSAFALPVALTYVCASVAVPAFVFEHVVVLLVLAVAVPWGLGPAVVTVVVSVASDNLLLREPIGSPTITGFRDALDLLLFAVVAIVVSSLVTRERVARLLAQQAADRERRAREERDRLVATVTHDLATPLSVLSGTVQFVKLRGATHVDWSNLLNRLETATSRATSLLRLLADAQSLDEEHLDLALTSHDLRSLVAPIVQMMDRFSERHPVLLFVPDRSVVVRADGGRLQRVIENLVNNAIKYSPSGGAVEVTVDTQGDEAILRVRDHGIGISADALPRIFERAFRAPEAALHAPGLGLGLSIAAQVVQQHGGAISAHRADGAGTCVVVRLPLVRQVVSTDAPETMLT